MNKTKLMKSKASTSADVETAHAQSSTDVETAHAAPSKSLKHGKSLLNPCSESKRNLKKQETHVEKYEENDESEKMDLENEIKEMKNSIRELTEAVKQVHKVLLPKAPSREEKEKECCFECEEAEGDNERTIFVKGFISKLPRDEIKNALSNHFGSCGEITRVFVPIECSTGASLGFAFIDFEKKGEKKALALSGSYLGGRKLEVMMAINRDEYYGFTGFAGCKRCATLPPMRRRIPTIPDLYLRP